MKKLLTFAMGLAVATTGIIAVTGQQASATAANCKIEAVTPIKQDWSNLGANFTVEGNKVTAKFKVTGDANCEKKAVLAVWEAPNGTDGQPLIEQEMFDWDNNGGAAFGPGQYTLTADMPDCYWQLDLLEGSDPYGIDGTANYGDLMDPNRRKMLDTLHGGDKSCDEVPETPEEPEQPEQPEEEAPEQETPAPEAPAKALPAELPKTGAGVAAIATLIGAGGYVGAEIRRRR